MHRTPGRVLAVAAVCAALTSATDARAFRMIHNEGVGRTSTGSRVTCSDAGGFVHWNRASIAWSHGTAGQGSKAGVAAALQNAMASWNAVSPAAYALAYAGTTTRGFVTDGVNTVLWSNASGCIGNCLAITALVLQAGQVISEADISFNDSANWGGGTGYDVEAVAAHEFGHTLGIHHTEITRKRNRPTMYASYFGTDGRTLESDDRDAVNCANARYPAAGLAFEARSPGAGGASAAPGGIALAARAGAGGAILRFAVPVREHVRLDLFDVAGRHLVSLVDGVREAGEHEIAWDGTTARGRVASGVYFARIAAREVRVTATVVLLR